MTGRVRRIRRCPVVLWGGRPDDYQFGSARDKARTERILAMRRIRRNLHAASVAIGSAFAVHGVKEMVQTMDRFATALRDVQRAARA